MPPCPSTSHPLTPPEVRQWFHERGITVTDWAREHNFPREVVYAAIAGRTRGYRGQAHAVAVALGLKKGVVEDAELTGAGDRALTTEKEVHEKD